MNKWTDLLPEPWNDDPEVIVVMVPNDDESLYVGTDQDEEMRLLVLKASNGERLGLQVMVPVADTYSEQNIIFRSLGVKMAHPAHFGRLSSLPSKYMWSSDLKPLAFNKAHMSHTFLDINKAVAEHPTTSMKGN